MAVYDSNDLFFSWNGDYDVGHDTDIADTSDDGLKAFVQDLHTIAASAFEDWEATPRRAASLDDFVGEPNTPITAARIHDRIRLAYVSNGLVLEQDLSIKVVPVHIHKVLIMVKVNATPTPTNKLERGVSLVIKILFDYFEQGIFFLDKKPILLAD